MALNTPPPASSPAALARMRRQRRQDTQPEVTVRRLLYARGYRYRVHTPVPGMKRRSIDISFPKLRVAVFLDGCFWHGCPAHCTDARANGAWWREKIARNRQRDAETASHLEELGWVVLRYWEHVTP